MKKVLVVLVVLLSSCSHKPLVMETKKPEVYTKDQVRRACWKGIKQACGLKGSCYEKAGNYCETEKVYQDIQSIPSSKK